MAIVTALAQLGNVWAGRANSYAEFDVRGQERMLVQLYGPDGWPSSLVVTAEARIGTAPWAAFSPAVSGYTAMGIQAELTVRGLDRVRLRVSTISSSDREIFVAANGVKGLYE